MVRIYTVQLCQYSYIVYRVRTICIFTMRCCCVAAEAQHVIKCYKEVQSQLRLPPVITTITDFLVRLDQAVGEICAAYDICNRCGLTTLKTNFTAMKECGADRENRNAPGTSKSKSSTGIPLARTEMCHGCERVNHVREDCTLKSHPQLNKTGSWSGSQTQLLC